MRRPWLPCLLICLLSACSARNSATADAAWHFTLEAVVGSAAPVVPQAQAPSLSGHISLPGAALTLSRFGEDKPLGQATTDADGNFTLPLDPSALAGQALLLEAHMNKQTFAAVVSVKSDQPNSWDQADVLATTSLRDRLDIWAQLGIRAPSDLLAALSQEAAALRQAIAQLSSDDAAQLSKSPLSPVLLNTLSPTGSEVAKRFTASANLLADAIRDRVSHGAALPTGPGMQSMYFGEAYAPPVYGGSGGGGASAPQPTPTPPGLTLQPQDGGFMDPTASETVHVGP